MGLTGVGEHPNAEWYLPDGRLTNFTFFSISEPDSSDPCVIHYPPQMAWHNYPCVWERDIMCGTPTAIG